MKISIANSLDREAREAVERMLSGQEEREYLPKPYAGFYVSLIEPEDESKVLGTKKEGDKMVYLVCENILGQPRKKRGV